MLVQTFGIGIDPTVGSQHLLCLEQGSAMEADPAMALQPIRALSHAEMDRYRNISFPAVPVQDQTAEQARAPRTEESRRDEVAVAPYPVQRVFAWTQGYLMASHSARGAWIKPPEEGGQACRAQKTFRFQDGQERPNQKPERLRLFEFPEPSKCHR